MIIGDNIRLRPLQKDDAKLFYKWRNDLEFIQLARSIRLPKHELLEENWLHNTMLDTSNRNVYFVIESLKTEEAIGFSILSNIDWFSRNAHAGIAIAHKEYRGKGLSVESFGALLDYAFNTLNLRKTISEVLVMNQPSIRMCERLGYKLEGTQKEQFYWSNSYHDVAILGLFKEEFNALNKYK